MDKEETRCGRVKGKEEEEEVKGRNIANGRTSCFRVKEDERKGEAKGGSREQVVVE